MDIIHTFQFLYDYKDKDNSAFNWDSSIELDSITLNITNLSLISGSPSVANPQIKDLK